MLSHITPWWLVIHPSHVKRILLQGQDSWYWKEWGAYSGPTGTMSTSSINVKAKNFLVWDIVHIARGGEKLCHSQNTPLRHIDSFKIVIFKELDTQKMLWKNQNLSFNRRYLFLPEKSPFVRVCPSLPGREDDSIPRNSYQSRNLQKSLSLFTLLFMVNFHTWLSTPNIFFCL